jgi:hypothetical protein
LAGLAVRAPSGLTGLACLLIRSLRRFYPANAQYGEVFEVNNLQTPERPPTRADGGCVEARLDVHDTEEATGGAADQLPVGDRQHRTP